MLRMRRPANLAHAWTSIVCIILMLCTFGCASAPKKKAPAPKPKPAAVKQKRVDAKAQQRNYDLGLQYYSQENYSEAKEAFEDVVADGPGTKLGLAAQENLKKIDRILKTLEKMESK